MFAADRPAAGTPFPVRLAELAAEPDRTALTCEDTTLTPAEMESATKNDANAFAPSLPSSATRLMRRHASSASIGCSGIGSSSGLPGRSHSSCHALRSCRAGFRCGSANAARRRWSRRGTWPSPPAR
ncbi:hypothetical protein [Saccharopolyspora spinosa]|uniref:hypothetical protein n=1 Tax=Saccharopolyspora spinosa TaxID=60894 RepID=UPI00192CCFC3|nr:hypothetical protein [Saccharopolyspora spinosa]